MKPDPPALRVSSVRRETPATRIVRVALGGSPFRFAAGQAARIGPAIAGACAPYSIACAPGETARSGELEFLVKLDADGTWGEEFPPPRRGDRLVVDGPIGSFRLPDRIPEPRLVFVAGGTGIAPLRSMMRHALDTGYRGGIRVLYSARTPWDFAYLRDLRGLARRGAITLALTVTREAGNRWRGGRGRVAAAALASLLDAGPARCFVCGPSAMVADIPPLLHELGVPKALIHVEQWRS